MSSNKQSCLPSDVTRPLRSPPNRRRRSNITKLHIERHKPAVDKQTLLTLGTWNARSIMHKVEDCAQLIDDYNLDILALTETWHEGTNSSCIRELRGKGFTVVEEARASSQPENSTEWSNHGGVAVIARRGVRITKIKLPQPVSSFEYLCCWVSSFYGGWQLYSSHTV